MTARCYDQSHKNYPRYGGRGIVVCERWRTSFRNFLADMGERPDGEFTIERKEVDGNYEPGNCIWLPAKDQGRNTTRSIYVEYEGHEVLLLDLCAELGLGRNRVYQRLKLGWPLEKALFVPIKPRKPYRKRLTSPDPETISS